MRSEMRELIAKWRSELLDLPVGDSEWVVMARSLAKNYNCALNSCADELEALLARTEAGADGAVAAKWKRLEFDRFGGRAKFDVGGVSLLLSHGEACIVDGILARFIADLTHPQDASGDAEDAAMFRWLSDNARPWESDYEEPHALIRICRGEFQGGIGWFNIIGRESRVGIITLRDAVRCAMQAKEAK